MTMLRVKNGPCAPLKLSNMLSFPATGMTSISVTTGAFDGFWIGIELCLEILAVGPGQRSCKRRRFHVRLFQFKPLDFADDKQITKNRAQRARADEDQGRGESARAFDEIANH